MEIPKIMRRSKYLIRALIHLEYPRKSVYDFMKHGSSLKQNQHNAIPKHCFFSWKTDLLTRSHYIAIRDFVNKNPDFEFFFFTDKEELDWMSDNFSGSKILDIYHRAIYGASKSDIFRTCLMLKNGGIFFSVNRLLTISLSNLIGEGRNFLISFDPGHYVRGGASDRIPLNFRFNPVVQWCMVSPPNHEILRIAIKNIVKSSEFYSGKFFSPPKEAIWNFDGPYMLTRSIDEYLDNSINVNYTFAGINYFESMYIPKGSEYRYAATPSYLGAKKSMILLPH
jgi:mannosyltransferase OCH1-like enzyme